MNKTELHNKIDTFSQLEYNWDSYGSLPITSQSILTAHNVLDGIIQTMFLIDGEYLNETGVYPMRDGGIQFEIGDYKEIEILDNDVREFLYDDDFNQIKQ